MRRPVLTALAVAVLGSAAEARAATFTVTATADAVDAAPGDGVCAAADGSCTLRAAVMEANALPAPDRIVLPAGRYTLTIVPAAFDSDASGDLDIEDDLAIVGAGPAGTIIDGGGIDRVFENFAILQLTSLTVRGGRMLSGDDGGGGIVNAGFLYLTDVVVRDNTATMGGGGILNYSDLFIVDSRIESNTVVPAAPGSPRDLGGGGIGNESNLYLARSTVRGNSAPFGGGLANDAYGFVTNSTLSGNTAASSGGGIWNDSYLTVVSSTIAGNSAPAGGAISDLADDRLVGVTVDGELAVDGGSTALANTILAGGCAVTNGGSVVSHGKNLARGTSCALTQPGDLQGVDPRLGPLQANGGPTETEALLAGSPAVDAGGDQPVSLPRFFGAFTGACPATDQRGYAHQAGAHCDIGAYESNPPSTSGPSYAAAVLDLEPVAYWRLGETVPPEAVDASGFENTGTYGGGVTLGVPGAIADDPNAAAAFDGTDGHVRVPPSVHLFSFWGTGLSVELWAKGGRQEADRYLVSHNDAGDRQGFGITTGPTGTLRFFVDLFGRQLTHDIPFEWDCRWHHIVGVYEPSSVARFAFDPSQVRFGSTVRLYVDGLERASEFLAAGDAGSPAPLAIGRFTGGGSAFAGSLDEVAVYRQALTPARIAAHAAFGSAAGGCGGALPASITVARVATDSYESDAFRPGTDVSLAASFSGPVASADLHVDGMLVADGIGAGRFDWTAPGDYAAHTLVLRGRDATGNEVASNALSLAAIVEEDAAIVSFLTETIVPDNPFSADPEAPLSSYPTGSDGFRQRHRMVLRAKTDGAQIVPGSAWFGSRERGFGSVERAVGESFYCDDPRHAARIGEARVEAPSATADGFTATSFLKSRVDVHVPMVFDIADIGPALQRQLESETSGWTGDLEATPWIFTTLTETVTPSGPRVEWRSNDSLIPLHFLYPGGAPAEGPLPTDLDAWLATGKLPLIPRPLSDLVAPLAGPPGAKFYFKALRAECARRRMATVNPLDYFLLHHALPPLPSWLRLGLRQDVFLHFNQHEVEQGVAKRGFVRDPGCRVPFCFGDPWTYFLAHSPVAVHVVEPDGTHVGPRPDGTIAHGSPAVTYEVAGHMTLVILPSDPAYRVSFEGTGAGLLTLDLQQFENGHRVLLEQFAEVPVTPGVSGSVELGPSPVVRLQEAALEPTTRTTSETPETEDVTPPMTHAEIEGVSGAPGFFRSAVTVRLAPTDDLSGVASSEMSLDGGATWSEYAGPVPLDGDGAYAIGFRSTDRMGNAEAAGTAAVVIDTAPPLVSIRSPEAKTYVLRQSVTADYACSDGGSGIAGCAGPVASGGAVGTGSVGERSFAVQAADRAGNTASAAVAYAVVYGICAGDDHERRKPKKAGSTVHLELELCDASARNVSSPRVPVVAKDVVRADGAVFPAQSPGRANPGNRFRFDDDGYRFDLATRGLTPGAYELRFTAGGDPTIHAVGFELR